MKILVTEMPDTPRNCLFSVWEPRGNFYSCTLRPYIEEADDKGIGYKPKCICKNCSNCDCLEVAR